MFFFSLFLKFYLKNLRCNIKKQYSQLERQWTERNGRGKEDPGTPSQLLPGAGGPGQTGEGPGWWGREERPPTKMNRQNKTFI